MLHSLLMQRFIALLSILVAGSGCATSGPCVAREARAKVSTKQPKPGEIPEPPAPQDLGAHVHRAMSCRVDPCTNFYDYACGGYVAEVQSGRSDRYLAGGFGQIQARNESLAHGILAVSAETKDRSAERSVMGSFFQACMAQEKVGAPGLESLQDDLDRIARIHDQADAMAELVRLHRANVGAWFAFGVAADPRDPTTSIRAIWQPDWPLPIEHLRGTTPEGEELAGAYQEYLRRLLVASGLRVAEVRGAADSAFAVDRRLAEAARTAAESERDDEARTVSTFATLVERYPGFPWLECERRPACAGICARVGVSA